MVRFSDNMRQVAVTEGDKVEAEIKFGWDVEYRPIGDIVDILNEVTEAEIDAKMAEYESRYTMDTDNIDAVRYQAKEEIAIRKMCEQFDYSAFVTHFDTLHGLDQLPGLAAQNMMADGYGFGAEGDWKVAAMVRLMKVMTAGMKDAKGTSMLDVICLILLSQFPALLPCLLPELCLLPPEGDDTEFLPASQSPHRSPDDP